jgi:iron complex outermembrane recepter protein
MPKIGSLVLLACLWPFAVSTQTVPLTGRVADALGGAINGAVVTVSGADAGSSRTARTGVDGSFSVDAVPPGSVTVQVEAPGFEAWTQTVTFNAATDPLVIV